MTNHKIISHPLCYTYLSPYLHMQFTHYHSPTFKRNYHFLGFPKVVPPPGTSTAQSTSSIRRQSSRGSAEAANLIPPRPGSFRQRTSPVHLTPPDKPPLAFCKRRLSWPEVDLRATSGWVVDSARILCFTYLQMMTFIHYFTVVCTHKYVSKISANEFNMNLLWNFEIFPQFNLFVTLWERIL